MQFFNFLIQFSTSIKMKICYTKFHQNKMMIKDFNILGWGKGGTPRDW